MLSRLLDRVETEFPTHEPSVTIERWASATRSLCEDFADQSTRLVSTLQMSMPNRLLEESKQELVTTRSPSIVICELRLRPRSVYYTRQERPVPAPENPEGPHATGVALSVVLCRGYVSRTGIRPACISVEFDIWGRFERACFARLLRDHGYAVERLVLQPNLSFGTACYFENVEQHSNARISDKLRLYYKNEDGESNFSLTRELTRAEIEDEVARSLLPLAGLYDMTLGYCQTPEERARAFDYLALLQ